MTLRECLSNLNPYKLKIKIHARHEHEIILLRGYNTVGDFLWNCEVDYTHYNPIEMMLTVDITL